MEKDFNNLFSDIYSDFFNQKASSEEDALANILKTFNEQIARDFPDPPSGKRSSKASTAPKDVTNKEVDDTGDASDQKTADDGTSPQDTAASATAEEQTKEPETDPMEDLEALIGLTNIKEDVKELIHFVKAQKLRKEKGMKTVPVSLHVVFSGNPGTGKTTVARILARLYKQIGALSKGQLVEVDRSAIVAGYVGQTAIKTQEKITEALGGVLFIDEAYTLATGGPGDFGQEAIDTILKAMEDHRDDLVVIVAGYTDLMQKFINSNPGLKSRFNKFFEFPDYTAAELLDIFKINCKKYEYTLDEAAEPAVSEYFTNLEANKGPNFANARDVRNYFEAIVTNQAVRVADLENPEKEDLSLIKTDDLP